MKLLLALVLTLGCGAAFAQKLPGTIDLGSLGGARWFVSSTGNERIGRNGVRVRVFNVWKELGGSSGQILLLTCDGARITSPMHSRVELTVTPTLKDIDPFVDEPAVPLTALSFDIPRAEEARLTKRAKALCSSAAAEPSYKFIPVATYQRDETSYASIAIVTGTAQRTDDVVELWMRTSYFRKLAADDASGAQLELITHRVEQSEPTGRYLMDRDIFDCKNKLMGTKDSAEFKTGESVLQLASSARQKVEMRPVVPGSIGETVLNAVCLLY